MAESKEDLGNMVNNGNSQLAIDKTAPDLWFEKDVKKIFGESDLINLFKDGLHKKDDETISVFYAYLRKTSPFKEWDTTSQIAYDLSRFIEPKPSEENAAYYKSRKICYCCHCLGLMCLCKYLINNYTDESIIEKIEKEIEKYLVPSSNENPVFYDCLRLFIISMSYVYSKELLKGIKVSPEAVEPISEIMNDFELFKCKTYTRFQAKYRPSLGGWLAVHDEISEQQIADYYAIIEKYNLQYQQVINTQQNNNSSNEVLQIDNPKNDQQRTNNTPPKQRKDLSHFTPYTPKKNLDVVCEKLFEFLKNKEGKLYDVDFEYFKRCIYCGDFTSLYNNDEDKAKTHIKVLIRYLHKHFCKSWFESALKSCGITSIRITTTKDYLKSEIEGIIEGN